MIKNKSFDNDLWKTYTGQMTINALIQKHEIYIRNISKYALRYNDNYLNDEDDVFQEACIWLVDSMWSWDCEKNTTLSEYVIYNIGARLKNKIQYERSEKRFCKTKYKISLNERINNDCYNICDLIQSNHNYNPEIDTSIRMAIDKASKELDALSQEILVELINNNGELTSTSREIIKKDHINKKFKLKENSLRRTIKKKIMPKIKKYLSPDHII